MNRKIIGILIIFSGTIALIFFVYFFYKMGFFPSNFYRIETEINIIEEKEVVSDNTEEVEVINNGPKKTINFNDEQESSELENNISDDNDAEIVFGKDELIRMAMSFSERFGSYSNQSNFSNVLDLKIFMTAKMKLWADKFVEEHRSIESDSADYFGVTTKAVSADVKKFNEESGSAEILVYTRRREATNDRTNTDKIYSQNILINFIKSDESWKIDDAFWQEE